MTSPIFPTSTSRGARVRVVTSAAGPRVAGRPRPVPDVAVSDMVEVATAARFPTLKGGELSTRHPLSSWPRDGSSRKLSFVKTV